MIRLTENFRINTSDRLNYTIQERKVVSDEESDNFGKEYWVNIFYPYYGSLKKALLRVLEFKILSIEEEISIKELIEFIDKGTKELIQAVKEVEGE